MSPATTITQSTRPPPDTVADIDAIIEATRGSADGLEHICDTNHSLTYLAEKEHEYLSVPASKSQTSRSGSTSSTDSTTISSDDEVFISHGFWSGPFNWRVELFIKSHLYTQNPSLSCLWLWIDTTTNPSALDEALSHPLATQFAPLISAGLLAFKPWTLPKSIPLPPGLDNSDGMSFLDNPERRRAYGFPHCNLVADSVMRDPSTGTDFLVTNAWAASQNPSLVSASDTVRFVVLHLYGGVYLDIDMLLLRDLRPLLLSGHDFAERWGPYPGKGEFNTAILAMRKMSSLSSYFLRTGVRLGCLFHPRLMGWQAVKDGREGELKMLESAAFDQVWPEFAGVREGEPATPSFSNFTQVFEASFVDEKLGTKRPVEKLFQGSWAYHMHNQWKAVAEPGSWIDAVMKAHDDFFAGKGRNGYDEMWAFPALNNYTYEGR